MSVMRLMHEEANLLDGIGDVREGESKVLKCAGQATVVCRVGKKMTIVKIELGRGVDGGGHGFAMKHVGTVKNLKCVLLLAEKQAGGVGSNIYAKKVM